MAQIQWMKYADVYTPDGDLYYIWSTLLKLCALQRRSAIVLLNSIPVTMVDTVERKKLSAIISQYYWPGMENDNWTKTIFEYLFIANNSFNCYVCIEIADTQAYMLMISVWLYECCIQCIQYKLNNSCRLAAGCIESKAVLLFWRHTQDCPDAVGHKQNKWDAFNNIKLLFGKW